MLNVNRHDFVLPLYVETANQVLPNQPLLFIIHGAGGISSCESLWATEALRRGYCVAWLDSLTPRGMFKIYWRGMEVSTFERSADIVEAIRRLHECADLIPFVNLQEIRLVGASHGGAVCVRMLTDRYQFEHSESIVKSIALYPGLHPFETDHLTTRGERLTIHVGELDNWTPAFACRRLAERIGAELNIYPGVHHGFSKPNSTGVWPNNKRTHMIPWDDPTASEEVMLKTGRFAEMFLEWERRGEVWGDVEVAWNEPLAMSIIQKELLK